MRAVVQGAVLGGLGGLVASKLYIMYEEKEFKDWNRQNEDEVLKKKV